MNPIVTGWYADPEARFYEGRYWIYVTKSFTAYTDQMNLDAFSSTDLIHWEKHPDIIDMSGYPYIHRAVWAPTIIDKDGKYYLIFASNDIQSNDEIGGLEIAVADNPAGPFVNHTGKTLVDRFIHHAQPIDAHLFKDDDGTIYLYYGGWKHCNVCVMNETMDGFVPHADGSIFKSVTPNGYVEGPCMLKRNNIYHFMWSVGDWVNDTAEHLAAITALSHRYAFEGIDILPYHNMGVFKSKELGRIPWDEGFANLSEEKKKWIGDVLTAQGCERFQIL